MIVGDCNLIHGDCLVEMAGIADASVDMILCDLPYGTTACKWDTVIPFEPLWAHYKRIIKPRGAIVLTASQPFTSALVMSNPKWFRYEWVWKKSIAGGFIDAKNRPMKRHETVLVFSTATVPANSKNKMVYNPQGFYSIPPCNEAAKKNRSTNIQQRRPRLGASICGERVRLSGHNS